MTDTLIQKIDYPTISHHGAVKGVTGSCHELKIDEASSVLIAVYFKVQKQLPAGRNLTAKK